MQMSFFEQLQNFSLDISSSQHDVSTDNVSSSFAFVSCDPGYRCVSSIRAFGVGHIDSNAHNIIQAHVADKTAIAPSFLDLKTAILKNKNSDESGALSSEVLNKAYEDGCPYSGFRVEGGSLGSDQACYPRTMENLGIDRTVCSTCQGFSREGFDSQICNMRGSPDCMCILHDTSRSVKRRVRMTSARGDTALVYHKLEPEMGNQPPLTNVTSSGEAITNQPVVVIPHIWVGKTGPKEARSENSSTWTVQVSLGFNHAQNTLIKCTTYFVS